MPDYTEAEKQRIVDLLDTLTGSPMSKIEAGLLFLSELAWEGVIVLGERDTLKDAKEARKECDAHLAQLQSTIGVFSLAMDAGYVEEGRWIADRLGIHFAKALPHLDAMVAELQAQIAGYDAYTAEVAKKSKANAFVSRVTIRAADAWARRGGDVDYGEAFREYFTAVVKPAIGRKFTERPWVNFVTKYRRLRGLPPLR